MLSNMAVFNQFIMPATIETLAQLIAKFNESSKGALQLTTGGFTGDFLQESFFAGIHAAQRRVDRYAANADVAPTDLSQMKISSVKVAGGFGPIRFEPGQMTWLEKPTAEGIEVASRNFAEALMADQLNTAIAALVAAIGNSADATADVSATDGISQLVMNSAHAKFGDSSALILANVMTGAVYHKLLGRNLANVERLFLSGTVNVVDVLGKAIVVTDSPALVSAGKDRVLGLVSGAAVVTDSSDVISNIHTSNGKARIETTLQVDYSFGLGLKGYTWDEVNGGKSPSDAALATGSNWDRKVNSVKHTAGVMAIGDSAK